jgi:DNA-binding SARP family transcriptional activator
LEIRLLGPFEVVDDGRTVPLGGAKQRALLAILAMHANEVLPADHLIEQLWPEEQPASARNTLQGYVSRLRRALNGNGDGDGPTIAFREPGYVLRARPELVDANRFTALVEGARGDPAQVALALREALGLWRGAALSDFAYESFAQPEIVRLEELRLVALEDRIDADLACGRDGDLVPELEALVAEHPLRERPRAQLMLALYRAGRQAEALAVYQDARIRLDEELGVEPTRELRERERAILVQDPALDAPVMARVRTRRRRAVVAVVGALALAAAVVAVTLLREGSPRPAPVAVEPDSVAVVDPASNAVVDGIPTPGWPRAIAASGGFVWVAVTGDDRVRQIDPVSRLALKSFRATTPLDLGAQNGDVWVANGNSFDGPDPPGGGTVERFDLATRKLIRTQVGPAVPGNAEQTTIAAGDEGIWVGNTDAARVVRLDPRTGRISATVSETIQVAGIAVGLDSVWAADPVNDVVVRIDPATSRVVSRIPVADGPRRLTVGEGAVWVVGEFPNSGVWRIDPRTNRAVAHVSVPARANWVAVGEGSVWVTSNTPGHAGPGSLTRIDPESNTVAATIDLGYSPEGVVVANGLVWVVVGPM